MKKNIIDFSKKIYRNSLEHKIISSIIILSVVSLGYYYYSKQTTTTTTYQYTTVKRGSITSTVSGTGQVISNSQVDLKPKVNANVVGVYVRAGDRVKVGQVLFRLDATDAYKQVRDAKTSLESAQISLEKLKNPQAIDVLNITNSIKQAEDSKISENQKVDTAYRNLLNSGLQVVPDVSYTSETAPTITGSYNKNIEGQIKLAVYQGGVSGYSFNTSGVVTTSGQINTTVAQPIGDTGLYIKWNSTNPQTNWTIDIPNKQSSNYLSNYTSWQNAVTNRYINNASTDRNIASYKQKLADLTPDDNNLDVRSAKLQVEQRQNSLTDAQTSLSDYVITAPFDGVMASVSVDIGASAVMASSNSSSALGTIVTDKKLAQITVNETDIVKIKLGQKVKMTFDAIDELEVDGDVVEINTLGTVTSGVVTYKIKIAFNTNDPRILPNMSVSADIITDSVNDVLYIPNQAVKHDADGYYVEKNSSDIASVMNASSTRRFGNGSSTGMYNRQASSTNLASSTRSRIGNGSSTFPRMATGTIPATPTTVVLTRVPVTIGTQSDTLTEITSGLTEGERVVLKKTTSTVSSSTSAPSVTSLLRPQGGTTRTTGAGMGAGTNFRPN